MTAQVERLGIVAVIRMKDPAKVRAVVDAMAEGGVRAIEVTMTVPGAVDLIRELAPTLPDGFLLGAGTVTDAATAHAVIDAGASFVVGPVFRPDVIAACHERDVPAMPAAFRRAKSSPLTNAAPTSSRSFRATMISGRSSSEMCAAAAAGEADADRRRHA